MNIQQSTCSHYTQRYFIKWKYSINYCSASKEHSSAKTKQKFSAYIIMDEVKKKFDIRDYKDSGSMCLSHN